MNEKGLTVNRLEVSGFKAELIKQRYGNKEILKGCTVTASPGECVGIAGRNGSGKSTFLSILAGMKAPVSGSLTLFGRDLLSERNAFGELIGYVPQTNPLIEELTVSDNLKLMSGRSIPADDPILEKLKLSDLMKTRVSRLSGGMKRRLAIACALIDHPPMLIMDEPTSALDLYHKSVIYEHLLSYRDEGGIVIMATHDIEEMNLCDRLYLIHNGMAEETTPDHAVSTIKKEDIS